MKVIETIFTLPPLNDIMNISNSENEPFQFKAAFWHLNNDATCYIFSDKQDYKMLVANDKFFNLIAKNSFNLLNFLPEHESTTEQPINSLVNIINQSQPIDQYRLLVINNNSNNDYALVCMENGFDLASLMDTVDQDSIFSSDMKIENAFLGEANDITVTHW